MKTTTTKKDIATAVNFWAESVKDATIDKLVNFGLNKSVKRPAFKTWARSGAISKETAAACWVLWRNLMKKPRYDSELWAKDTRGKLDAIAYFLTTPAANIPRLITNCTEYRYFLIKY